MAEKFSQEYFREPWRGYGGSVVDVFNKLKAQKYEQPFKPAAEQFNGSGSYGNGAGKKYHLYFLTVTTVVHGQTVAYNFY